MWHRRRSKLWALNLLASRTRLLKTCFGHKVDNTAASIEQGVHVASLQSASGCAAEIAMCLAASVRLQDHPNARLTRAKQTEQAIVIQTSSPLPSKDSSAFGTELCQSSASAAFLSTSEPRSASDIGQIPPTRPLVV